MRKFIVKNFALNRRSKVFGYYITSLKVGRWTMLSLLVLMIILALGPAWKISIPAYVALAIFLVLIFIGFFYFHIWPVKWHELSDDQKIQAGHAIKNGQSTMKLTESEWEEWLELISS